MHYRIAAKLPAYKLTLYDDGFVRRLLHLTPGRLFIHSHRPLKLRISGRSVCLLYMSFFIVAENQLKLSQIFQRNYFFFSFALLKHLQNQFCKVYRQAIIFIKVNLDAPYILLATLICILT